MKKLIIIFSVLGVFLMYCAKPRPSSYPLISGDTFRAIADHIIDETKQSFHPANVKYGDIIFLKTDYVADFFSKFHALIPHQYILITHNSDFSPIYHTAHSHPWKGLDFSRYLDDSKLIVWFAQNIDFIHEKLIAIPIGIANSYNTYGNIHIFLNALKNIALLEDRFPKIYINFSLGTNQSERKPAYDYFKTKSFAYVAQFKPVDQYLEEMKQYRFVVNPPGNGLDCHRVWEALLLGCIPIIKHSSLDSMFENLPVILINDWTEVTEEFLEIKYQEIMKNCDMYNKNKIYADYWIDLIKSYKLKT